MYAFTMFAGFFFSMLTLSISLYSMAKKEPAPMVLTSICSALALAFIMTHLSIYG